MHVASLTRAGMDNSRDGDGGAGKVLGSRVTPAGQPEPSWARRLGKAASGVSMAT